MTTNQIGLQLSHVLGIDRNPNTGIYMPNENTIIYFAGNNLVNHNLETHEQRFLPYTDNEKGDVKCVAVTPNITLLAYGLEIDASTIYIIDVTNWVKRKTPITLPAGSSPTTFSALAFSSNGKNLIAQGASSEALLYYFEVQNGSLLGHQKITNNPNSTSNANTVVNCISFNPTENNSICCTGRGIFRQLTKSDKGFIVKQGSMTNKDSVDFKSHIWTSDGKGVVVSSSDGRLGNIENSSVMVNIALSNTSGAPVTNLTATPKGFICVTGGSRLHFFEKNDRGFVETSIILVDEKETIASIAIIPGEEHIGVLMSDARVLTIPITGASDGNVNPTATISGNGNGNETSIGSTENISTILPAQHIGAITGMDVAFRKQLLVTCGEDHSIRVMKNNNVKLQNSFLINHFQFHFIHQVQQLLQVFHQNLDL